MADSLATIATYCKWTLRQLGYDMSCCMSIGSSGSLKIYSNKSSQLEIPTIKSYLCSLFELSIQPLSIDLLQNGSESIHLNVFFFNILIREYTELLRC